MGVEIIEKDATYLHFIRCLLDGHPSLDRTPLEVTVGAQQGLMEDQKDSSLDTEKKR